jgi:hypothetical protein
MIAVAVAGLLAACGQQQKAEAPEAAPAAVETPAPAYAPMPAERTALCSAALEAWKGLGASKPPGDLTISEFGESAPLLGLRSMELEIADAAGFKAAKAAAETAWKDKTPADIEAATVACLDEIDP